MGLVVWDVKSVIIIIIVADAPLYVWSGLQDGGGSGASADSSDSSKKGRVLRISAVLTRRSHKSTDCRSVGCPSHSKTCCTLCSSHLQHGEMLVSFCPTRYLKSLTKRQ